MIPTGGLSLSIPHSLREFLTSHQRIFSDGCSLSDGAFQRILDGAGASRSRMAPSYRLLLTPPRNIPGSQVFYGVFQVFSDGFAFDPLRRPRACFG